ncbi:MAG TPA: PA2169 family four-helix-bundle protein [Phycisphaerae bacterium]|nr:PA2169 family four-helix-bundle protein [Phycisphaerae bacterium]
MNLQDVRDQSINQLQELLSINIDSQKGFQEAADSTSDTQLKSLFAEFSQKRAHNAAELRSYITSAGELPTTSGSVFATVHRWWLDARIALTGKDPKSILDEAERGEDSIKKVYEDALGYLNVASIRELVERQYRNVREDHDRVKSLRDSYHRNPRG